MQQCSSNFDISKKEAADLLNSVDYVFLDIDGVLVNDHTVIPGGEEFVAKIRELGKTVSFVTNNSVYPKSNIVKNIEPFGAQQNEIVTPNDSIIAHLKKINYQKDLFVIGSSTTKKLIREAGFNIIELKDLQEGPIEETIAAIVNLSLKALDRYPNVGAVLVDADFNFTFVEAQLAIAFLNKDPDVIFFAGLCDDYLPVFNNIHFVGIRFLLDGLERWSKKSITYTGKPGLPVKDVLFSKYNITDPSRVLLVGDTLKTDIALGNKCNFKTLLVLSGSTKEEEVTEWKYPEELRPTVVLKNLGSLYEKIKDL